MPIWQLTCAGIVCLLAEQQVRIEPLNLGLHSCRTGTVVLRGQLGNVNVQNSGTGADACSNMHRPAAKININAGYLARASQ